MAEQEQDTNQPRELDKPRFGDPAWDRARRSQAMSMMPSKARLDDGSSFVTLYNTSPKQRFIVMDRHMRPHELAPGQRKPNVEMTDTDIQYYSRQGSRHRFDNHGMVQPPHPVRILEAPPQESQRGQGADDDPRFDRPSLRKVGSVRQQSGIDNQGNSTDETPRQRMPGAQPDDDSKGDEAKDVPNKRPTRVGGLEDPGSDIDVNNEGADNNDAEQPKKPKRR